MTRRKALTLFLALLLAGTFLLGAAAETIPYAGYSYDEWNVAIPSKVGYLPTDVYYSDAGGTARFLAPGGFFCRRGRLHFRPGHREQPRRDPG